MKPIHELTASECLRERFDMEAALASAPSPTGDENGLLSRATPARGSTAAKTAAFA